MGKIIVAAVIVIAGVAFFVMRGDKASAPSAPQKQPVEQTKPVTTPAAVITPETAQGAVKEFSMTSYFDADGKWFSLKEISVKKGDTVRIKVTNTKGTHDFNIDEYSIKQMTPLDVETVIEFVADKAGVFEYYCSMPGHRAGGQVGTLKVTE
jgi:heme/copper-type cytochrome/quinol oxidase subunit 2